MNKQALKEELVDLRMKLAEAENQGIKVTKLFPLGTYSFRLACEAHINILSADDKLCELAKLLGLEKLDVVKSEELGNWGQGEPKRRGK